MARPDEHDLIYDWNRADETDAPQTRAITFDDETLRDGLQSPSVRDPSIDLGSDAAASSHY